MFGLQLLGLPHPQRPSRPTSGSWRAPRPTSSRSRGLHLSLRRTLDTAALRAFAPSLAAPTALTAPCCAGARQAGASRDIAATNARTCATASARLDAWATSSNKLVGRQPVGEPPRTPRRPGQLSVPVEHLPQRVQCGCENFPAPSPARHLRFRGSRAQPAVIGVFAASGPTRPCFGVKYRPACCRTWSRWTAAEKLSRRLALLLPASPTRPGGGGARPFARSPGHPQPIERAAARPAGEKMSPFGTCPRRAHRPVMAATPRPSRPTPAGCALAVGYFRDRAERPPIVGVRLLPPWSRNHRQRLSRGNGQRKPRSPQAPRPLMRRRPGESTAESRDRRWSTPAGAPRRLRLHEQPSARRSSPTRAGRWWGIWATAPSAIRPCRRSPTC